jgi:hypothetical protein
MKGRASLRLTASVSKFRPRFKNGDRKERRQIWRLVRNGAELRWTQDALLARRGITRSVVRSWGNSELVGRGSVRTGVSRPPADDAWTPTNEPLQHAAPRRSQRQTHHARSVHHSGSFVWVHPFARVARETPVRTEPFPTILSDALCLGAIISKIDGTYLEVLIPAATVSPAACTAETGTPKNPCTLLKVTCQIIFERLP